MRICLVSSSFYPATFYGGPISATWDLSKKLTNRNIEIFVSTTNANGNKKLDVVTNKFIKKKHNLFVKYYNEQILNKLSIRFVLGLWSDIKAADLIYIQYLFHYTVFFSLIFSVFQNKKIIICPRGSFSHFTLSNKFTFIKSIWLSLLIGPLIQKISWQASSYLEAQDILRRFSKAEVEIINDGVDWLYFQNAKKFTKREVLKKFAKQEFADISYVFFSMGRLHRIKRFDVLIDAFSLFRKENINAKLLIAGTDDGVKDELLDKIQGLNLSDSVFLIGSVNSEDKKILLSNCDVFALASEFESFGIVIAEALACGCPVVVSTKTPWKDLEINNCGILADNEKYSFYHAFKKVFRLDLNKDRIRNYVKSNYDLEVIVGRFINAIKNK